MAFCCETVVNSHGPYVKSGKLSASEAKFGRKTNRERVVHSRTEKYGRNDEKITLFLGKTLHFRGTELIVNLAYVSPLLVGVFHAIYQYLVPGPALRHKIAVQ